jgi:hypothetical protein
MPSQTGLRKAEAIKTDILLRTSFRWSRFSADETIKTGGWRLYHNSLFSTISCSIATTILDKACRERIRVTTNGKTRYLSKFEAAMLQLMNKAASGDLRAMQLLLGWLTWRMHSEIENAPPISLQESDKFVMESIAARFRSSGPAPLATEPDMPLTESGASEDQR